MNFTQMIIDRNINDSTKLCNFRSETQKLITNSRPFHCTNQYPLSGAINHIDIDTVDNKFLLSSLNDGSVSLEEIQNIDSGNLQILTSKKYCDSSVHRCQWYPIDNGMFSVTCPESVSLIDTNTFNRIDVYNKFDDTKLYWSSWNQNRPTIIAVSCASSSIRIIDIKSGSSVQQITTKSGSSVHDITRVLWSPLDSDFLIAGDSYGSLHIYDVRRLNKSISIVECDQTVCEPITCLTYTNDNMCVVSCHGINNKIKIWNFMCGKLCNSNINFQTPINPIHSKVHKKSINSAYLKCQIFLTDSFVFAPSVDRYHRSDILVYDRTSGMRIQSLSASCEGSFYSCGVNCVNGLKDYPLLYSGGHQRLSVWTPRLLSEENNKFIKSFHCNNWSDSD